MFSRNLKFYRLKAGMSKRELADRISVSPMAVTNYEKGDRRPSIEVIRKMAEVLDVRVSDFLVSWNDELDFEHNEYRKTGSMNLGKQEYICECIEEYFGRFFDTVELLGGNVLPDAPEVHALELSEDREDNGRRLRAHMGMPLSGPLGNMIEHMENNGILIYISNEDLKGFSGINGSVNGIPYIAVNGYMNPERIRMTIAHELVHISFKWPDEMDEKDIEKMTDSIAGAFMFPEKDAVRELGIHRSAVTRDMEMVCREYGVSMYLLTYRAEQCGIINESTSKKFYIEAGKRGWRTNEPSRIEKERSVLFEQLVYRGINEGDITFSKGAELLGKSYDEITESCCFSKVRP